MAKAKCKLDLLPRSAGFEEALTKDCSRAWTQYLLSHPQQETTKATADTAKISTIYKVTIYLIIINLHSTCQALNSSLGSYLFNFKMEQTNSGFGFGFAEVKIKVKAKKKWSDCSHTAWSISY